MQALKTMKRTILGAAMALLAAPAWAGDAQPLRIGWVSAMANAPVLIAEKKGFFKEEGLAVELRSFGDGPVIQQAVASGDVDVAYVGAPPVYQWFARGLDSVILAKVNYGQAALVAKASGPIRTLADLKGQRLAGVNRGSGMDVLLRGYILKDVAKLDPETDLQLSQMPAGNMNAALDTGVVDAVFEWEPFISQSVLRGAGRVVFDFNEACRIIPGTWLHRRARLPTRGRTISSSSCALIIRQSLSSASILMKPTRSLPRPSSWNPCSLPMAKSYRRKRSYRRRASGLAGPMPSKAPIVPSSSG